MFVRSKTLMVSSDLQDAILHGGLEGRADRRLDEVPESLTIEVAAITAFDNVRLVTGTTGQLTDGLVWSSLNRLV